MVVLKLVFVLFGKLIMKLFDKLMFGWIFFSLCILDLYLIVVWLCFIKFNIWLELFWIGKCRWFINFGIDVYVFIMLLVNLIGCEVV